jgi:Ribbon-helix-helix protein, copG family
MRRIQVVMDPELDDWLEHEASARGVSKSALIRDSIRLRAESEAFDNGLSTTLGMFTGTERVEEADMRLYGPFGPS